MNQDDDEWSLPLPGEIVGMSDNVHLVAWHVSAGVTRTLMATRRGCEQSVTGRMRDDDERRFSVTP